MVSVTWSTATSIAPAPAATSVSSEPWVLILMMVGILIAAGCVMETTPNIVILAPILKPLADNIGMNEIQFCIMMITALGVGFITPPLGLNLFVVSGLTGESILKIAYRAIPFVFFMLCVTLRSVVNAQGLVGQLTGILLVLFILGEVFSLPPVNHVLTVPGPSGPLVAFAAEFAMALGLMLAVLFFMNSRHLNRLTGLAAGVLVATYITVAAPLSGMSINPARTFASATPSGIWSHAWVYFTAPILGMLAAVELYRRLLHRKTTRMCAKLDHPDHVRCIHCGHEPLAEPYPHASAQPISNPTGQDAP